VIENVKDLITKEKAGKFKLHLPKRPTQRSPRD
jgi:hypothetical protein